MPFRFTCKLPESRDLDQIEYAERFNIPITVTKASPYSIDQNLWGRTIECGILEDPWEQPPEEVYELTTPTATEPTELVLGFEQGVPVALAAPRHRWASFVCSNPGQVVPPGAGGSNAQSQTSG